ncbi:hypothetical protein KY290_021599 [Solanum tuberosum]|uniref:Saposin-like type B region 1 domain-containing protein n=1 Tax=Solanum tuberosum TaxID=4113 RepID=A0ABQ7V425_SOLTU|nr:hypothetical protein KY284_020590 [Solanum tuberosum]KAH0684707.1 hypothetical protein KY289_022459 [Solanum tuberosum]KAH0758106.1 hypothetical protein KY290_021599 [Solanum tuberosum]
MCFGCEIAVIWMENQLRESKIEDRILHYLNEVKSRHYLQSPSQIGVKMQLGTSPKCYNNDIVRIASISCHLIANVDAEVPILHQFLHNSSCYLFVFPHYLITHLLSIHIQRSPQRFKYALLMEMTELVNRADEQDCTIICALVVKLQSYGWRIN